MSHPVRRAAAVVVLSAFAVLAACAVNPVTGKKELMLIPEATEIEMGKSTDQEIRQEFGLYQDAQLSAYVDRVSRRMVPYVHRKNIAYHFAVLDTPVVNAFAAPGGYVYVTRGLLAMANSEAELATVIGHELGHVNARHSARQMSTQLLLTGGVLVAGALSKDVAKIAPFMLVGLQVLFLKFSRDDEYQADQLGVTYSRAGNYSPGEMIPFFSSIQRLEEGSSSGMKLPNFLSTHPLTARRIEEAKKMLLADDGRREVRRNEFLATIDGLVYGDDPRQGYVSGNAFIHPQMRFAFDVPQGWAVQNTPKQVMLAAPDQKAVLILQAETSEQEPEGYAREKLKGFGDSRVDVLSSGARRINGLSAFRGLYDVSPKPAEGQAESGTPQVTTVDLGCIRKDGMIYTFLSAAAKGDYGTYSGAIDRAVRSFRPVTDATQLAVKPRRVSVRAAGRTATFRDLLRGFEVPEKSWKALQFLNSLTLDQTVEKGKLIKILQ